MKEGGGGNGAGRGVRRGNTGVGGRKRRGASICVLSRVTTRGSISPRALPLLNVCPAGDIFGTDTAASGSDWWGSQR